MEIASIVAFLVSDEASYISGQVPRVDGGRPTWAGIARIPVRKPAG